MLWLSDLEDEAVAKPLVRQFDLLAIDEFLAEEAIFVADGVAMSRIAKRSDGIKEAGSKTAKPAIP